MNSTFFSFLAAAALLGQSTTVHASTLTPINPFDPDPETTPGFVAGIDFNLGTNTQTNFLGIPASNSKSYSVITNGVTFDMEISNANLVNQSRDRGERGGNSTFLTRDFEQWWGDTGTAPEFAATISGLTPGTEYEIHVWHYNMGAGQNSLNMYDGASSSDPLIGVSKTAFNELNYETWIPGSILGMTADETGKIVFTAQASSATARININGIMVASLGPPPFEGGLEITSIEFDPDTDQATLTFTGSPNTEYACVSSSDLVDFSTSETPVSGSLTTDESGNGSVVISAADGKKFFRLEIPAAS